MRALPKPRAPEPCKGKWRAQLEMRSIGNVSVAIRWIISAVLGGHPMNCVLIMGGHGFFHRVLCQHSFKLDTEICLRL
jgi:hypothetical protein